MNMPSIGHNAPPSLLEFAGETQQELSKFLVDQPVIQDAAAAKQGASLVQRAKNMLADIDTERDGKVRPLNSQVRTINDEYKAVVAPFIRVLDVLKERLDNFRIVEGLRRAAEADEKRRIAQEAEEAARAAELVEREAKDGASVGECTDLAGATLQADAAFTKAQAAAREAARAEAAAVVRLRGDFGKALPVRTKETIYITDLNAVLDELYRFSSFIDPVLEAIRKSARAYRKQYGRLPEGVTATTERSI